MNIGMDAVIGMKVEMCDSCKQAMAEFVYSPTRGVIMATTYWLNGEPRVEITFNMDLKTLLSPVEIAYLKLKGSLWKCPVCV